MTSSLKRVGEREMSHQHAAELDRTLVDRCLLKEGRAWNELYSMCHPRICGVIRRFIRVRNEELVDELSARVWIGLVQNEHRLLAKFCADRGARLTTFLSALARNIVRDYLRAERRRKKHELALDLNNRVAEARSESVSRPELDEFLQSLSPGETQFVKWSVGKSAIHKRFSDSANNDYQLRHRLRNKLLEYFR